MAQLPDYDDIADSLGDGHANTSPAETHGTLCGLLCTAAQDLPDAWIRNTLADAMQDPSHAPVGAHHALQQLYVASVIALDGDDMAFSPLLPPDDRGLEVRTAALAGWCQGFLYGLAVRGLRDFSDLEGEIREFLEDMVQISRAEIDDTAAAASERDEAAYAELVEYVRVGVQLFYEAANAGRRPAPSPDFH